MLQRISAAHSMSWILLSLRLGQIGEEHPAVSAFLAELGLPPPRLPDLPIPLDDRARTALLRLAEIVPIRAVAVRPDGAEPVYRVVGGIRTARFLTNVMAPDTLVSVWVAQTRLTKADIKALLAAEWLLAPALLGDCKKELPAVGAAWVKSRAHSDLSRQIPDWSIRHLARYYRTSEQRLIPPRKTSAPPSCIPSAVDGPKDTE
ncbi:MAG: hypothetical protein ACP5GF_10115 [Thiomonas sp.]